MRDLLAWQRVLCVLSHLGLFNSHEELRAVLRRPGGGFWITDNTTLWDAETGAEVPPGQEDSPIEDVPFTAWHQFKPRDEQCSARMRAYTVEQAAKALESDAPVDVLARQVECSDEVLLGEFRQVLNTIADRQKQLADLSAQLTHNVQNTPDIVITPAALKLLDEARRRENGKIGSMTTTA